MKQKFTHYPSYDVMNEKNEWDDHTQEIVVSRLNRQKENQFLTSEEVERLKRVCSLLVGDKREEIIQFIIEHIDQTLTAGIGEGERKVGVPKAQILIRTGLNALDITAKQNYLFGFISLAKEQQQKIMEGISKTKTPPGTEWEGIAPQDFFKKVMGYTIEAYCSHPTVWSEMGYGGPAYPRGYVRTQLGQLDPWEAQPEHE